jgi:hypothetical protein
VVKHWVERRKPEADWREVAVTIPVVTRSETNMREHWTARHTRRANQRQLAGLVLTGVIQCEGLCPPIEVLLTRLAPRALDSDNVVSAMKAIRDGIADAMKLDDGDKRIAWQYAQRATPEYGVEVVFRKRR